MNVGQVSKHCNLSTEKYLAPPLTMSFQTHSNTTWSLFTQGLRREKLWIAIKGKRKERMQKTYPICMQCSEICCNEEDRTRLQGVKNKKQKDEKVNWKFFIIYGKGEENRVNIKGKRKNEWMRKRDLAVFVSLPMRECRFRLSLSLSLLFHPNKTTIISR